MSVFDKGTFSSGRYGFMTRVLIMAGITILGAKLLPGVYVASLWAAIMTAMLIAILDNVIRPILLVITLPISFLTNGLFVFVVNTAIIMMASGLMGPRFHVASWGYGLLFSLILTLFDYLIQLPAQHGQNEYAAHKQDQIDNSDEEFTPYEEVND